MVNNEDFLLAFVAFCGTAHADTITVAINFAINSEYLYASGGYNPLFVPENITVIATFDDTPTSRTSDPHDIDTFFGTPSLSSPLTTALPYGSERRLLAQRRSCQTSILAAVTQAHIFKSRRISPAYMALLNPGQMDLRLHFQRLLLSPPV
jgi:hypothetical protein